MRSLPRLVLVMGGLVAGIAVLAGIELALRALGVGADFPRVDPFAEFSATRPLFERVGREDGTVWYQMPPESPAGPAPAGFEDFQRQFAADKEPGTYRIFVIGGSSAAGVPYSPPYAFSGWLARRLRAELPGASVEIVNAAVSGYATRRELIVVRELARYQPDLLIVYSGHNEFAERRYYAHLLDLDPRLFRLWEAVSSLRLYRIFLPAAPSVPTIELNDAQNNMQMFAVAFDRAAGDAYPDARERAYGEMLYRFNLEEIVHTMRGAGAQVMFLTLGQDFADWRPGASRHREGLSAAELARWDEAFAEGDRLAASDCAAALGAYERARAIDDEHADLWFRIASCERRLTRFDEARAHFRRASDLDCVPHGAPTRFNDVMREVAATTGTWLADGAAALERAADEGLVGSELFADFVHPNLRGHQVLAAAVAGVLREQGVPRPASQWRVGAYVDEDPGRVLAAEPVLRAREHLSRALTCVLARRNACALEEAEAAVVAAPGYEAAVQTLAQLKRQRSFP